MTAEKFTMAQRLARLAGMVVDGRVLRGSWRLSDDEGREHACLLVALAPEVGTSSLRTGACPAEVMPRWLAHITPALDDNGTLAAWPAMVRRYAEAARRWHVLDAEAWERVRNVFLERVVADARASAEKAKGRPYAAYAADATYAVSSSAASSAASADAAAAVAVYAVSSSSAASSAAYAAAAYAADAAAAAAYAARAVSSSAASSAAYAAAAREQAWDRFADYVLGAIEAECLKLEQLRAEGSR